MSFIAAMAPYLMATSAAVSAGSSIMSGISQTRSLESQAKSLESQAQASAANVATARENAAAAREAGEYEKWKVKRQGQRLLGRQIAAYGASGLDFEGSPLLVMEETAADIEREALAAKFGYEVKARRWESEAGQYDFMGQRSRAMADMTRGMKGSAIFQGVLGAGTRLLSGLGVSGAIFSRRGLSEVVWGLGQEED